MSNPTQHPAADPDAGQRTHRTLLAIGLVGGLTFAFLVFASARVYGAVAQVNGLAKVDRPMLDWMISLRTPLADSVITAYTNLGTTFPMVSIALVLTAALYWRYRRRTAWVLMLVAAAGSVGFTLVGKPSFARPRPPILDAVPPFEVGYSFPSGHTLNSTVVAGMLAYLTVWLSNRWWPRIAAVIAALAWSLAMGLSRIYLGHHWFSDVLFAWLVGLAWLAVLIMAHQFLLRSGHFAAP